MRAIPWKGTGGSGRAVIALFGLAVLVIVLHVVDLLEAQSANALTTTWEVVVTLVIAGGVLAGFVLSPRPLRGVLALAIGTGATIEGAGIAAVHLAKGAAADVDYTGIVSLAGALCLIALGAILLTLSVPNWWRLLAFPGVLALIA